MDNLAKRTSATFMAILIAASLSFFIVPQPAYAADATVTDDVAAENDGEADAMPIVVEGEIEIAEQDGVWSTGIIELDGLEGTLSLGESASGFRILAEDGSAVTSVDAEAGFSLAYDGGDLSGSYELGLVLTAVDGTTQTVTLTLMPSVSETDEGASSDADASDTGAASGNAGASSDAGTTTETTENAGFRKRAA